MAIEITMPKLSDTMTEGHLGVWRKSVGDRVERGDIIAEVETDKATMELEAFASGILLEQRAKAGELISVGSVIGLIGTPAEAAKTEPPPATAAPPLEPASAPAAAVVPPEALPAVPPAPAGRSTAGVQAAPVVRRRAAELGIDLAQVRGSGPEGRIMLEDLQPLQPSGIPAATAAEPPPTSPATGLQPFSRMRSAIARTTVSSWQTIPHFYLSRDLEMDRAMALRTELQQQGVEVSLNGLIMAAVAAALVRFPALNSCCRPEGIIVYPAVNLAFAVALDDGLQMPVIKAAESKSLAELTVIAAGLTAKAHLGTLSPADLAGGSFAVSNLGMYGVDTLASLIMPGQAAILGLGAVTERVVVHGGQAEIARVMTATLSCDHRIIDGAVAAAFMGEVKRLLEQPEELPA